MSRRGHELEWQFGTIFIFDPTPFGGVYSIDPGWRAAFLTWNGDTAGDFSYICIDGERSFFGTIGRYVGDPNYWVIADE